MPAYTLPTITQLANDIHSHWMSHHDEACAHVDADDERSNGPDYDSETLCDVRLWATSSDRIGSPNTWGLEFGDASYDLVHGDWCADTTLDLSDTPDVKEATEMARWLIATLGDQMDDSDGAIYFVSQFMEER